MKCPVCNGSGDESQTCVPMTCFTCGGTGSVPPTPMNLYFGRVDPPRDPVDPRDEHACLIWDVSLADAHRQALAFLKPDEEERVVMESRDVREGIAPKKETPHIEGRTSVLRRYDFACDGDDLCEVCGLAEMDGHHPVCRQCGACGDCGHRDTCPIAVLFGRELPPAALDGRFIYLAGPYANRSPVVRRWNTARIGLISRMMLALGAVPVTVHAAIDAGHYGDDADAAERMAGMTATRALMIKACADTGLLLVLEGRSRGTEREVDAWQRAGGSAPVHVTWAMLEDLACNLGLHRDWQVLDADEEPAPGFTVVDDERAP